MDDLPERLPVTAGELDLLERYLGGALDEFLERASSSKRKAG
jgi:hypothetical protein